MPPPPYIGVTLLDGTPAVVSRILANDPETTAAQREMLTYHIVRSYYVANPVNNGPNTLHPRTDHNAPCSHCMRGKAVYDWPICDTNVCIECLYDRQPSVFLPIFPSTAAILS